MGVVSNGLKSFQFDPKLFLEWYFVHMVVGSTLKPVEIIKNHPFPEGHKSNLFLIDDQLELDHLWPCHNEVLKNRSLFPRSHKLHFCTLSIGKVFLGLLTF